MRGETPDEMKIRFARCRPNSLLTRSNENYDTTRNYDPRTHDAYAHRRLFGLHRAKRVLATFYGQVTAGE